MKKIYQFTVLIVFFLMFSCTKDDKPVPLSTENKILSFTLTKESIVKKFTVTDNAIEGKVESEFELNQLKVIVTIPAKATISPDPSTITSITVPIQFTITAENGDKRIYLVSIQRELSIENTMLEFNINTEYFSTNPNIDEQTGKISKRLPEFVNLKNLKITPKYSKYATISPDPSAISDYSSPVKFTVKSESGKEKEYEVSFVQMNTSRFESCSDSNAWKWFGGDDRKNVPDVNPYDRNVGTGQAIVLSKDLVPSSFGIHLSEGFAYYENQAEYNKSVTLKLIIRDDNGKTLGSTTSEVSGVFNGGFIFFNLEELHLYFQANKAYVFYWYLVNGESLGITAPSSGNTSDGTGFCFNTGYSGESKTSKNSSLDELSTWYKHSWHFNIQLLGNE